MAIDSRHHPMMWRLLKWVAYWVIFMAVPIVVLQVTDTRWVDKSNAIPVDTVAQIVPAVVIAIFVFAVGTAFVVAQIVPPARGTRAVTMLRRSKLEGAIAPAPVLLAGSAFLIFETGLEEELACALILGSVVYTVLALYWMLATLVEATDPAKFKDALLKSAKKAQTTDQLYESLRTIRGWTRVAARSNDSRELQESLEGMLELVEQYTARVPTDSQLLTVLPEAYLRHRDPLRDPLKPHPGMNPSAAHRTDDSGRRWFADEVGRAILRATELALQSQTLLDRDTSRLLNTLTNIAQMFHRQAKCCPILERSAVVTLHYLTQTGLGARHCPPDRLDWYLEPCVRLACLHDEYSKDPDASQLSIVSAAGVLLIAEALVAAKEPTSNTATTEVVAMISRAVAPSPVLRPAQCAAAVADAWNGRLEPRERAATYQCDKQRLKALAEALSSPAGPNPAHA